MRNCKRCNAKIRYDRYKNDYCSKKCEADEEGYSEIYTNKLDRIKADILGSTAWCPDIEDKPMEIIAHKTGIMSDIHCPFHSADWCYRAVEEFLNQGVTDVILNGDTIDANTISRHRGNYEVRHRLENDLDAAEKLVGILANEFKVHILQGNHCQRMIMKLGGEVSVKRLWKLVTQSPNVKITAYDFVHLNGDTICGHPRQYKSIRGALPQELALLLQKNIITGHAHHSAVTIDKSGKFWAVDMPCLADLEKLDYYRYSINTHARMLNGFGVVTSDEKGSKVQLFNKFSY